MPDVFDDARKKGNEAVGNSVAEALKSRGFAAEYVPSREEALKRVLSLIPAGASVGVPGTVTVREIGAIDALAARGCTIYQHWGQMTPEERIEARFKENGADFFLTSANAVTADGRIIAIDGTGNRVAAMAWGPGKLIFVVGVNKIASNLDEGIRRARAAEIPNALRLGQPTACAGAGRCVDCRGENRGCRAVLVLEAPTTGREAHVIIVGESLGY